MKNKIDEFLGWNVYQIYPRSFMDSNGDGIGDLRGVISKIDYLADLGINAVWLSPFFKSPNDDNGYDISDYRDIAPEFGTLDDCKEMIKKFHEKGIKVIIDLVVNHTSTEHYWFKEARKSKDNPYRDYYIWADKPLNDWNSCFGGPAWAYDEKTNQYYLHSFVTTQADLNWENPKVREEVNAIVDYWVDLGVDGFRCDVLDMISKDLNGSMFVSGPHLHEYIRGIFGREKTKNIFTVGECWSADEKNLLLLTGNDRGELTCSFLGGNVDDGQWGYKPKKPDFNEVHNYFANYETLTQEHGLTFAPFFENHDRGRSVSRFADIKYRYELATFCATVLYTCRGTPFILQGEEFGTPNGHYDKIEDFNDVSCINFYNANKGKMNEKELIEFINFITRDNGRHPMAWNKEKNGGFSTGKPWIVTLNNYKDVCLEQDLENKKSIHNFYKRIIHFRRNSKTLIYGKFQDLTDGNKNYFKFTRTLDGETLLVVCNYENDSKINIPNGAKKILGNYSDEYTSNIFKPFETAIFRIEK